ncbi:MAG TPA: DUF2339 domain-containing protein [Terriglobia bacterium]|nr:DUF2339 domain-containing protein [Terriglobia bacterium]
MVFVFFLLVMVLFLLFILWQRLDRSAKAWKSLADRVYALEQGARKLELFSSRLNAPEQRIHTDLPAGPAAVSAPQVSQPETIGIQSPLGSSAPFPAPHAKSEVPPLGEPAAPGVAGAAPYGNRILQQAQTSNVGSDSPGTARPRGASVAPALVVSQPPRSRVREWLKKAINYEEMIGGNLFTKLGIIFLVLGLSLFVATQWRHLGPGLRILIGYLASGLMLAAGMIFERREKWRIFARAGIGGGWALLYFVTYAMHHVVAPPLISSEAIDLVLMIMVAAGMISHTLKYRSQVVTGLALLLAFTTVTISQVSIYSLVAGALLAIVLVIIVWQLGWYELEIFGIVAAFLNHYLWLRPIIARVGAHHVFPEYTASCALLIFYWAIFNASYIARRIRERREETVSTVALLLNIGLFLGVMGYQSVDPPRTFLFFLSIGAAELALGQLKITRRRRTATALLTSAGAILLVAAFPSKFSGPHLSVLWLAEAEAFVLAGIFAREIIFRWLGLFALVLTAVQMLIGEAANVAASRWGDGPFRAEPRLAVLFGFAAVILYANAHWLTRRWGALIHDELEDWFFHSLSYPAGVLALATIWLASPRAWVSPLWALLALILLLASRRWSISELRTQAHSIAAIAYIHALFVNLPVAAPHDHWLRAVSVASTAAFLYAGSRWAATTEGARGLPSVYRAAASSLVAFLAWYELRPEYVGPAWIGFALLLMFLGRRESRRDLQAQAHILSAAGLMGLLTVNLGLGSFGHFNPVQLLTVGTSALALYLGCRWVESAGSTRFLRLPEAYSWSASILLALLAWRQLEAVAVAVAWTVLGLLLFEIGFARLSIPLRSQGYALFTAAFVRMLFSNLNAAGASGKLSPRLYTMVPVALAYFYVHRRLSDGPEDHLWRGRLKAYEYLCYLGVATVAILVRFELPEAWVAAAWAALAAGLLWIACITDKKLFLTQGLLMGLAAGYRAVLFNLYQHSYFGVSAWQSRPLSVSAAAALLLLALIFAFRLRSGKEADLRATRTWTGRVFSFLYRRPEQFFFLAPVALIAMVLSLDLPSHLVTFAWGLEAVAIIVFALAAGERSYRLTGLALLLLCIGKVVFVDLPRLWGTSYFYLTLIGLGSSLVLVSYLYTRYREKFRRYL